MVGDITYIPTWEGWLYLATVIDCHTKKVVGYAMDDNYKTPLIMEAVHMAARNVTFAHGAIFHSDRGGNPGLNLSSQHLDREVCYGARARLGRGNDGQAADAVARSSTRRPQGTSAIVLDSDLAGATSTDAGLVAGVSQVLGTRWFRECGGVKPQSVFHVDSGRYLSFAEREQSRSGAPKDRC